MEQHNGRLVLICEVNKSRLVKLFPVFEIQKNKINWTPIVIPIESKLVSSCVQLWFMVPVAGVDLRCGAGRLRLQSAPGALPRAFGFDPC